MGTGILKNFFQSVLEEVRIQPLEQKVQELLQDLDTYRALVESTTDHIFMVDRQCRYQFINRVHLASMNLPLGAVLGRNYGDFHHPEGTRAFAANVGNVFQTGLSIQQEHNSIGDKRHFLRTFSPVRLPFPMGEIKAVAIVSKDITELKQVERLYQTLTEKSPFCIYILQNGQFHWVNQKFAEFVGYAADELSSMSSLDIVCPDDAGWVRCNAIAMLKGEAVLPYEYRVIAKDGDVKWCREAVVSVLYKGIRSVIGSAVDITAQKAAEEALATQGPFHQECVNTIDDAYYEVDLKGNAVKFNDAFFRLSGYGRDAFPGTNYRSYMDRTSADAAFRAFNEVFRTGVPKTGVKLEIKTPGGQRKKVEASVSPVRAEDGVIVGFDGVIREADGH